MKFHAPVSVVFTSLNLVFSLLAFNRPVGAQGGSPAMEKKQEQARCWKPR